jgi:predicted 3-demethylubiquinone-9 3-methyltransferase (glyoxalase superfamily)
MARAKGRSIPTDLDFRGGSDYPLHLHYMEEPGMPRAVLTQLMFEGSAEEAMNLYVSLFKGSAVQRIERYAQGEQGAEGSVKRAEFTLGGHHLSCIDSPIQHGFTFTPSMSLFVECADEAELDASFQQLSAGGGADAAGQLRVQHEVRLGPGPLRRLLAAEPGLKAPPASRYQRKPMTPGDFSCSIRLQVNRAACPC